MLIKKAFTLIEIIIVIAIVLILAAITIIVINPVATFQNARNVTRGNDLQTINTAITKYIADTGLLIPGRNLTDLSGYSSMYAGATILNQLSTPGYQFTCANGVKKLNLPPLNDLSNDYYYTYTIDSSTGLALNLNVLLDNNYLTKVPKDPLTGLPYQACIDTANSNQLILYAPQAEGNFGPIVSAVAPQSVTPYAWDSFARNSANSIGNLDNVNGSTTTAWSISSGSYNVYSVRGRNEAQFNTPSLALVDTAQSNGKVSLVIRYNAAGNFGVVFRSIDSSNYWFVGTNGSNLVTLNKIVGGSTSSITSLTTLGPIPDFTQYKSYPNSYGTPNVLEAKFNGSIITATFNGITFQQANDPTFATATKHGAWSSLNNKFSDFIMTGI